MFPFLTACMSRVSTLRSKAVRFMVSNTSLRVWPRPCSMWTISSGYFFMALLMNRSRCFWFMQEDACMCVSTWSQDRAEQQHKRYLLLHWMFQFLSMWVADMTTDLKFIPGPIPGSVPLIPIITLNIYIIICKQLSCSSVIWLKFILLFSTFFCSVEIL